MGVRDIFPDRLLPLHFDRLRQVLQIVAGGGVFILQDLLRDDVQVPDLPTTSRSGQFLLGPTGRPRLLLIINHLAISFLSSILNLNIYFYFLLLS